MSKEQELLIKVAADTGKAIQEINRLTKEVDKLQKQNKKVGDGADGVDKLNKSFGKLAKTLGGLAVAYAGFDQVGAAISLLSELEGNLIDIAKTTGLSDEELQSLNSTLADLSKEMTGIKYTALQEIAAQAGQLGIKGVDNIAQFSEAVAKIAVATEFSAQEAAIAFSNLGNALRSPVSETENLASAANELSANTSATVTDIVEISNRAGGMATQFGLTSAETLGLAAALKNVGLTTEIAGTSISRLLSAMLSNYGDFATVIGVSADEFAKTLKDKPIEALKLFLTELAKMDKVKAAETLKNLSLSGAGVSRAVLALSGDMEKLNEVLAISNESFQENKSINDEYTKASNSYKAAIESLGNSVEVLVGQLGGPLLDALTDVAKQTTESINSMDAKKVDDFAVSVYNLFKRTIDLQSAIPTSLSGLLNMGDIGAKFLEATRITDLLNAAYSNFVSSVQNDRAFQELGAAISYTYVKADELNTSLGTLTQDGIAKATAETGALITKNAQLIEYWRSTDPVRYADLIVKLSQENENLSQIQEKIASSTPYKKTSESAEDAAEKVKILLEKQQKQIDKEREAAQNRVDTADSALNQLYAKEVDLRNKIAQLEAEKAAIRQKYANQRLLIENDYENFVADARQNGMSDFQRYTDDQNRAAKALSDARAAYDARNFDLARQYLEQYDALIKKSAGDEIKEGDSVLVSRSASLDTFQGRYKEASAVRLGLISQEEAKEIAASNAKIQAAQNELQVTVAQITMQRQIISLWQQLIKTLTGVKPDIDTKDLDKSIAGIKKQISDLEKQKKDIKFTGDTTEVKRDIDSVEEDAKNIDATIPVSADTSDADDKIVITRSTAEKKATTPVDADTSAAMSKVERFRAAASADIVTHQYIYQHVITSGGQGLKNGGPVRGFKNGGHALNFDGGGRVSGPGTGTSDSIPAMLSNGEYVIRASAVRKIGAGFLDRINRMQLDIPGFASGGSVSSSSSSPADFTQVNINLGSKSAQLFGKQDMIDLLSEILQEVGI